MRLLVVGAGGHAKVVIDAARLAGYEVVAVIGREDEPAALMGAPLVSDPDLADAEVFIVAIGDNTARATTFAGYVERGFTPATVIHPSAVIAEGARLGEGTFVAAGVIVNVHAHVGANAILNTGCTVDHDCVVGAHSLIGPNSTLCGGVTVGEGVLLGAGVSVVPLASVGAWSTVGAGAAVVDDLPDSMVFAGVPAVPLKRTGA